MNIEVHNNRIINAILRKIQRSYRNDIAIFACYGSFVTGNNHELSDIDFYVVPKTTKGKEITKTFILNDIGYDLWAITWERIEKISNLETPITSILMDSEILFHSTNDDLQRYQEHRKKIDQALNDDRQRQQICEEKLRQLQSDFCELMLQNKTTDFAQRSINFVEDYLVLLATVNKCYVRKGLHNIINEVHEYSVVPDRFLDRAETILGNSSRRRVMNTIEVLLCDMRNIVDRSNGSSIAAFDPNRLAGFYEETKSIYNKLIRACREKDYFTAVYSAKIIDQETAAIVQNDSLLKTFPSILRIVNSKKYGNIERICKIHERKVVELYGRWNAPITAYKNIEDFEQNF